MAAHKCRLILNEVFECDDVEGLMILATRLFELFPAPNQRMPLAEVSPHNT